MLRFTPDQNLKEKGMSLKAKSTQRPCHRYGNSFWWGKQTTLFESTMFQMGTI